MLRQSGFCHSLYSFILLVPRFSLNYYRIGYIFLFPLIIASKMTLFLFVSIRILTGKSSPLNLRVLIRMTIRSIANVTQRHTSCVDAPLSQENYIINMTYRFLQIYFVSETPSSVYPRIIGTNF